MKFIVYRKETGKILRTGSCPSSVFSLQADSTKDEFVIEGIANDITQKVIDGKIVDKTPDEIEGEKPKPVEIPEHKRPVILTQGEMQDILKRLDNLENK